MTDQAVLREIVCGRQPLCEMFRARRRKVFRVMCLRTAKPCPQLEEILRGAREANVQVDKVDRVALDRVSGSANHQGVVADVSVYPYVTLNEILVRADAASEPAFLMVMDHLQDPQNVGSLLRTADAAGVHGVILPLHRAAEVTPAVVRASAGASEHVLVAQVGSVGETLRSLKREGVWVVGLESVPEATLYTQADLVRPLALVVGAEDAGLGKTTRETCDYLIRLPLQGKVTSLNASVAGALALYEVRRQRNMA